MHHLGSGICDSLYSFDVQMMLVVAIGGGAVMMRHGFTVTDLICFMQDGMLISR